MSFRRAALALAALLGSVPAAARAASVWTAVASEKIRPQEPARPSTGASIEAAKNEFESFQIVVTGKAHVASVVASELKGAGTISGVKVFREQLQVLSQPSSLDGGTGPYPDALMPDVDDVVGEKRNAFPFDVNDGESRAIWVDVFVPPDAPAGDYDGTVTVRVDQQDVVVPVHLEVWDFALPSTPTLKSAFGLGGGVANQHNVTGDALSALRARYAQLALDHRISLHNVASDMQMPMDWNRFDSFYGPLLDGSAPTRLQRAKLTASSTSGDLASAAQNADWAGHFKSRGWFGSLFQYTCDEPPLTCNWSDIVQRAQAAKAADPAIRTLVTTTIDGANQNGVTADIDAITPVVNFMDDRGFDDYGWTKGGDVRSTYDEFLKTPGKELWLYESCMSHGCGGTVDMGNPSADDRYSTGWPSYMVDASSVRARALEWFSFRYGATGELYYETTMAYYQRDPWTQGVWDFTGNGDGTLFYPGTIGHIGGQTEIPVASIRLKMIREGMEDFEYLNLLAKLGDAEGAKKIAARLFADPYKSDVSVADLMAAREAIAHRILELQKPVPSAGAPADSTTGTVSINSGSTAANYLVSDRPRSGCGTSTGERGELLSLALVPLALVLHRARCRRRRA